MIDALISGRLIRTAELKTSKNGKPYCQFILSVPVGDEQPVLVSGVAFQETAEKIAQLQKGDPVSVIGSLKPTEWIDKTTSETKRGLSVTVSNSLSPYDIKKRKPKEQDKTGSNNPVMGYPEQMQARPFNDDLPF
jgi:single-stranded DNA-binding protein